MRSLFVLVAFGLIVGCGTKPPADTSDTRETDKNTPKAIATAKPEPETTKPSRSIPDDLPDAAARKTAVARLKAIHKAAWNFHDAVGHFPAGVIATKDAVGLSWRVQLLPYLGHEDLFKQFKLNEAWDSDHNKKLLDKMPDVFASAGKPTEKGNTFVRMPIGFAPRFRDLLHGQKLPPFTREPGQPAFGLGVTSISDGSVNTILFAEFATAVPWTKPDEADQLPPVNPKLKTGTPIVVPLPKLGGPFDGGFHAILADGVTVFYKGTLKPTDLQPLLTPAGGERCDPQPAEHVLYIVPWSK